MKICPWILWISIGLAMISTGSFQEASNGLRMLWAIFITPIMLIPYGQVAIMD